MTLSPAVFVLAGLAAAAPAAEPDADLALGQRYLDTVAAEWSRQVPFERVAGVYFDRKWTGSIHVRVSAAPQGSDAAFEVKTEVDVRMLDQVMNHSETVLFTRGLQPVRAEGQALNGQSRKTRALRVEKGRWLVREDKDGRVTEHEGEVRPGLTWDPKMLPLFARPDVETLALEITDADGRVEYRRLPPRSSTVDGIAVLLDAYELKSGDGTPDVWTFRPDGRAYELSAGDIPLTIRPIAPAQKGKDLADPLQLHPAARAVVDMMLAVERNDREAALLHFDLPGMAAATVPGYAHMDQPARMQAIAALRAHLLGTLFFAATRPATTFRGADGAPPVDTERLMAAFLEVKIEGRVARVKHFRRAWSLHEVTAADGRPRWLIVAIPSAER
jgi:hypothetical protein